MQTFRQGTCPQSGLVFFEVIGYTLGRLQVVQQLCRVSGGPVLVHGINPSQ